jgi:spore germination cell wall hydrolase CwlJ-like protein
MLTRGTYRGGMTISIDDLRLSASLVLLVTSASCVPALGSTTPVAPAAKPVVAKTDGAQAERMRRAREIFWQRLAKLFEPVSAVPAAPFDSAAMSGDDRDRSLECLTDAISYEARSEPEAGQRAVAQVVLNRVRHPAFPASVCGVVFQGSQRSTGCQFSFTCDGSMDRRREPTAWARARLIAEDALAGSVFGPVGKATHYHTLAVHPYWAAYLRKSAIVGSHIFYRWSGSAGEAAAFRQKHGGLEPVPEALRIAADRDSGDLPVVHVGVPSGGVEEVRLEDSREIVTIHRGNRIEHAADAEHGVTVHIGSAPAIG